MNLTRYEFELLSALERQDGSGGLRALSDALTISRETLKGCLSALTERGLVYTDGGVLSITDDGLLSLEPYRVRRAVILAAGFGSRMVPVTLDRPKPLVTVRGRRIIDTLLDALLAAGITDITLVRGYKKERFDELKEKYPTVAFLDNDVYDTTNNISSAMLALPKLAGGCYLCEADLYISNPGVITKYQYASNILGSWSLETDDWCWTVRDGRIADYRKGGTHCFNYYGISYWTPEDCDRLRDDFRAVFDGPDGRDYFWEFIPLVLRADRYAVQTRPCRKEDIVEIDSFDELVALDPSYERYDTFS